MSVRDFIKNSVLNADSYSQVDIGRIALSLRVEFYSPNPPVRFPFALSSSVVRYLTNTPCIIL